MLSKSWMAAVLCSVVLGLSGSAYADGIVQRASKDAVKGAVEGAKKELQSPEVPKSAKQLTKSVAEGVADAVPLVTSQAVNQANVNRKTMGKVAREVSGDAAAGMVGAITRNDPILELPPRLAPMRETATLIAKTRTVSTMATADAEPTSFRLKARLSADTSPLTDRRDTCAISVSTPGSPSEGFSVDRTVRPGISCASSRRCLRAGGVCSSPSQSSTGRAACTNCRCPPTAWA